jgi:hypothetical protein
VTGTAAEALRSGQLADAAGLNLQTLRYYERRGLLAERSAAPGGHRRYPVLCQYPVWPVACGFAGGVRPLVGTG